MTSTAAEDFRPIRVTVVGGGFSGGSLAVQLVRRTRVPVDIKIIEPRGEVGRGLAYSATDPDHRLNSPLDAHAIDPECPGELRQWCLQNGVFERDPECALPSGEIFLRRGDLGAYLADQVSRHARDERLGSTITHVRGTAVAATRAGTAYRVALETGVEIESDVLVIATGNPPPSLRPPFTAEHARDARIIGNPLEPGCLERITPESRVLVVGSGLTALDILSTFLRRGHRGELLVVSRRGLRPRGQARSILAATPSGEDGRPLDMLKAPVPGFLAEAPLTVRAWCRALRHEIESVGETKGWHAAFDPVRNVVWKLWPRLPQREKERFLRRLRLFYDVHRFRTPPMNDEMARTAESQGRIRYAAASVQSVVTGPRGVTVRFAQPQGQPAFSGEFDYVVNCTGLDAGNASRSNPFLACLMKHGWLRVHPTQLGFDVAEYCEAIDAAGEMQPTLRVIGPPTAGAFGDPLGLLFIAGQIHRIIPDLAKHLECVAASGKSKAHSDVMELG